jgi:hypothetical protein
MRDNKLTHPMYLLFKMQLPHHLKHLQHQRLEIREKWQFLKETNTIPSVLTDDPLPHDQLNKKRKHTHHE